MSNPSSELSFGRVHLLEHCWCGHSHRAHNWDAARDWRELDCLECKLALRAALEEEA